MSKTVSIVAAGAAASLQQFASAVVAKATGNAVSAVVGADVDAANAVVIGADTPRGVHTSVVTGASDALYAGVKATIVRAILPRSADDSLPLRDAVDVLPASGINSDAELDAAQASYRKSAAIAVETAKANKASKLTVALKQQSKYVINNRVFQQAAKEAAEAAGLGMEVVTTAAATNALLMFPESVGVVFTNDNPTAENLELAFAGVASAQRTLYTEKGGKVSASHGGKAVASAVAQTLKGLGLANEAKKIEAAVAKAKSGAEVLANL